jgi:hypothetical protein
VKAELRCFGNSESPVVVIDDFSGELDRILEVAERLAPYPPLSNYYPGVRRVITPADKAADAYVAKTCERAARFIGGAFNIDGFELLEASFSIVSTTPELLSPPQRAPHFDTTDQRYIALLHYLRVPPESGTAFYRQRSTGIERVTESNLEMFVGTAQRDAAKLPSGSGYIQGSDEFFEEIGAIQAAPDRLIIYQGSLLHSGIIPTHMSLTSDPGRGRLTANLFVRGY